MSGTCEPWRVTDGPPLDRRKFVLLHGAWHGGWAWDGVARELRRAGHEVETPTLPGMSPGEDRAAIRFGDYVEAVIQALERQHGKVIVVGHSSAGTLMQAAIPYVARVVDMVVFSNAFVVSDGQSQLDNMPEESVAGLTALWQSAQDGAVPFEPMKDFIRGTLMEGDPVEKQDELLQRLAPQPFSLFSGEVRTRPFEALDVPRGVLFCRRDRSADYLGMAARLATDNLVVAEGSHEMLFSDPVEYTEALRKLVARKRR